MIIRPVLKIRKLGGSYWSCCASHSVFGIFVLPRSSYLLLAMRCTRTSALCAGTLALRAWVVHLIENTDSAFSKSLKVFHASGVALSGFSIKGPGRILIVYILYRYHTCKILVRKEVPLIWHLFSYQDLTSMMNLAP